MSRASWIKSICLLLISNAGTICGEFRNGIAQNLRIHNLPNVAPVALIPLAALPIAIKVANLIKNKFKPKNAEIKYMESDLKGLITQLKRREIELESFYKDETKAMSSMINEFSGKLNQKDKE